MDLAETGGKRKVLLVTNIPTPYRIPLFNEIYRQLSEEGIDFKVIFAAPSYPRRKWEIDYSDFLFRFEVLPLGFFGGYCLKKGKFLYCGLMNMLKKENPDVVIASGFSLNTLKTYLLSKTMKVRYIIWSGAVSSNFCNNYNEDAYIRRQARKLLVKSASSYIAYGSLAKNYLIDLGANNELICIGINTVNVNYFNKKIYNQESINRKEFSDINHLLYIGELNKRKNVKKLLEAIFFLNSARSDFVLDIIGDGPERKNLENYVSENKISERVVFHGYKQKHEIPKYMSIAKCFLFQTDFDIWGLVLNEAMAAGVPCLSSIFAGATVDLINEGETGFAVDFSDIEGVSKKIHWILDNPEKSKIIGDNARDFILQNASPKKSAQGFLKAIRKVLN